MDDQIFELIIVPILAPVPVAMIGLGFRIDNALAENLKSLSPIALDISFIRQEGKGWQVVASTLPTDHHHELAEHLSHHTDVHTYPIETNLFNDRYIVLMTLLDTPQNSPHTAAFLQYSRTVAMEPYKPLFWWLLTFSASGLFLSLIGGHLIARSVTKPVRILADTAHQIEQGDYSHTVTLTQKDEIGQLAGAFNHMIAGIAEREEKISYQAKHDSLTGLPNRLWFEECLEDMIRKSKSKGEHFSVVLVGIQRFSEINNTLGHEVGDGLIRLIGERLHSIVKRQDSIARLASDEFILLMPGAAIEEANSITKRFLFSFEEQYRVKDLYIDVPAHIGISCYPDHGEDASTLMQKADVAMFLAQQNPGRSAIYDAEKDPYNSRQLTMMGELRQGLQADDFSLYFQPKIDIALGRITQVESLIRWIHPEYGFMPPDDFIPQAEQTGYIQQLTSWVLNKAIKECSRWQENGIHLTTAVNLSTKDLLNPHLPDIVAGLLKKYHLSPDKLVLEVTESAIMQDYDLALATLTALSDMGLSLSVDDFGTGYSSMGYLNKLPVNELKIDKSFVQNLASKHDDEVIVRSIIDLGHNLGMKVIAEGVEDQESMDILKKYGCDMAQGYLMSRPLALQDFIDWLETSPWGLGKSNNNTSTEKKVT